MNDWIVPEWPAPACVRSLVTTRNGGVSTGPYASLNLGLHVGDDPVAVAANRARLREHLPAEPAWLNQVHGTCTVLADAADRVPNADASFTRRRGVVCAVMTADCLPVLFADDDGTVVAVAHAGWRGLAAGVLEATIAAMEIPPTRLHAWLGPAIGPQAFEVGAEVRSAFVADLPESAAAFMPGDTGKWLADIYTLARLRLRRAGVDSLHGGGLCTVSDAARFYSYRRDGTTGRMASLIWLE